MNQPYQPLFDQQQFNQTLFNKALQFAARAHRGQTYQTSIEGMDSDYMLHIHAVTMGVMWALADGEYDADLATQCALLHDVLEDTPYTYEDLHREFGQAVADGVQALSKNPALPKEAQMADSLSRIRQQPREIWMVKLADRINNLEAPPWHWTRKKAIAYREEGRLIHTQLCSAHQGLADRLMMAIEDYARYCQ